MRQRITTNVILRILAVCVSVTAGSAGVVTKTVTPKPVGSAMEVSQRVANGTRSATLSPDSKLGRQWELWLSQKRVARDDDNSYAPDLVVTGETYQVNFQDDRVIFSWRNPPFSETSTQQSWKATDEDRTLRRDLLDWLQNEPTAKFQFFMP